jgi:hypothetical protein
MDKPLTAKVPPVIKIWFNSCGVYYFGPLVPHDKELSTLYSTIVLLRFSWFAQGATVKRRGTFDLVLLSTEKNFWE